HLGADAAGAAAVVRDGDHSRDVVGQQAQRAQVGGEAVPAAERDHAQRPLGIAAPSAPRAGGAVRAAQAMSTGAGCDAHSRARSRWRIRTALPVRRSSSPIFSATATLRCLPPVHPIASVVKCLFSALYPRSTGAIISR